MIQVTRLNGSVFVLNADLIETVEATPDTVVKLTTEHTFVVREGVEELVERVVAYRRRILAGTGPTTGA
ncbi:MAG: flagellar FlbD family protein [Candidatus Sericytochromatia bacterium]|nr:flagellar FlbD family protein [Candidatus Sericytochromatia bacterium]